jgi:hypothetical protein
MRERTAFILFGLGMGLLAVAWMVGLKLLGVSEEDIAHTVILILPVASLGGGWLFMRYR